MSKTIYKTSIETESMNKEGRIHEVKPLKEGIVPGTILILLAGRFKGAKVVYLRRLESGLLLVTGPCDVSGVPLQRIDQAYVVVTSIKLNIESVEIPSELNDSFFDGSKQVFTGKDPKRKEVVTPVDQDTRKAIQKSIDEVLVPIIKKVDFLTGYMGERFRLREGDVFHKLKF